MQQSVTFLNYSIKISKLPTLQIGQEFVQQPLKLSITSNPLT
jgi:hypothetical protein